MKKIAFLFLIIDNPHFPKLWNSYFRGRKDKYSIYIHPKYPEKTTWKKDRILANLQPTEWGFITRAYFELFQEAYRDPDNQYFITISESDVPIQSFDALYDRLTQENKSWVQKMPIRKYDQTARLDAHPYQPRPSYFMKHYARMQLIRKHVAQLLQKKKELEFFHTMHVGDEFFLSVLYPLHDVVSFAVTYDDWEYTEGEKQKIKEEKKKKYAQLNAEIPPHHNQKEKILTQLKELNEKLKKVSRNPKTITNATEDIERIKKCSSFFYRKFARDCGIDTYWKEILQFHTSHNSQKKIRHHLKHDHT
jgi:hypothetical protein